MSHKRRLALACVLTLALALLILPHTEEWKRATFHPPKEKKISKRDTKEERRANEQLAKTYAQAGYGWKGGQWQCLKSLWSSESRFDSKSRPYDKNGKRRSSAFGIAQLLRETSSVPEIQILHGFRYIIHRYSLHGRDIAGAPCRALRFHLRHGWY